jgi:hypothetical protein
VSCLLGSFALGLVQVRACRREANRGVDHKADKGGLTGRITPPTCHVFRLKTACEARLAVHHTRCPSGDGKRASVNAARNLADCDLDFAYIRAVVDQFDKPRGSRAWVARNVKETLETRHSDQVVGSRQNHGR